MEDNSTAVQQIRESVKKMNLFRSIEDGIYDFKIIHDFKEANFHAFKEVYYDNRGAGSWTNVRELQFCKVTELVYKEPEYKVISREVYDMEIPEAEDIFYSEEALVVEDEIYEDLRLCIQSRKVCGYQHDFFERMFKIYELGGWPCGWEGKLTEGRFIAYFPLDEDAEE